MKDLFTSEKYREYLKTMSKFSSYSLRNTMLIHMQKPDATKVAGYSAWQSKFGRYVKRGEKGIYIYAPMSSSKKELVQKLDPETQIPLFNADGKPVMEEKVKATSYFKLIPVFDYDQTDGKPLPSLVQDLTGDVRQYDAFVEAVRRVSPLPIEIRELPSDTDGRCIQSDRIEIRKGMSEVQTVLAMIHEITHALLHDKTAITPEEAAKPKDKATKEAEAEGTAYVVTQHYSIETADNSFGYLQSWSSGRELPELKASLETIRKTSAKLIDGIDTHFMKICAERGIELAVESPEPPAAAYEQNAAEPPIPAEPQTTPAPDKQYDLGYGHMGNGLTVWNRLEEKDGDYVTVAHISPEREVKFYDENMPEAVKARILETARTTVMTVSATQDAPVFSVPPLAPDAERPTKDEKPDITHETPPQAASVLKDGELRRFAADYYSYIQDTYKNGLPPPTKEDLDISAGEIADFILQNGLNEIRVVIEGAKDNSLFPEQADALLKRLEALASSLKPPEQSTPSEPLEPSEPENKYTDIMPDPSIGISERDSYGYTDSSMLPLSQARAVELLSKDFTVYLLYPNNTEAMAFEPEELAEHDGIFGIERVEWEASQEYRELADKPRREEAERESGLIHGKADMFGIYQLKDGDETRNLRFESLEAIVTKGLTAERGNYRLVYTAPLSEKDSLDSIFYTFNNQCPKDFTGHSLSISDIVELQQSGYISSHYVDGFGFKELSSFLGNETPLSQRQEVETDISTSADDVPDASVKPYNAAPAEPETFGQNVAELEAQVKTGQSISVLDLANTMKKDKKPLEKSPKISILAHIEKSRKEAAKAKEQPRTSLKRDGKDVLGG